MPCLRLRCAGGPSRTSTRATALATPPGRCDGISIRRGDAIQIGAHCGWFSSTSLWMWVLDWSCQTDITDIHNSSANMTDNSELLKQTEQLRLAAKHLAANDVKSAHDIIMPLLNGARDLPGLMPLYARLWHKQGSLFRDKGDLGKAIAHFSYACETDRTFGAAQEDLDACLAEWERTHKEMMKYAHGWWMPVTDLTFSTEIPLFGKHRERHVFEMQHISVMVQGCKRRRRAIDIGGHIGSWSWVLADHFQTVETFEPNPLMQACFRKNVEQPNVTLHPVALGKDEGRFGFVAGASNTGISHIAVVGETVTDEVDVRRLDSYGFTEVDFIKLDAEGFETFIIAGGADTLVVNRPVIFMEVNGCAEHYGLAEHSAIQALEALGAKVTARSADGNYVMKWDEQE